MLVQTGELERQNKFMYVALFGGAVLEIYFKCGWRLIFVEWFRTRGARVCARDEAV